MNKKLATYAMISTNNKNDFDYLAHFEPFIIDLLKRNDWDYIEIIKLKSTLIDEYKLDLPESVIKKILARLTDKKIVIRERNSFLPNSYSYKTNYENLDSNNLKENITNFEKKYIHIINMYIDFCLTEYNKEKNKEQAKNDVINFMEKNQMTLLQNISLYDTVTDYKKVDENLFLVANFIKQLIKDNSPFLDDLVNITKGNMLIDTLYFNENSTNVTEKFKNTTVFFDTSIVMFALGFSGNEKERTALELINILIANKANISMFRHNLEEIQRNLTWTQHHLHTGTDNFDTIQYFLNLNYEAEDIEYLIHSLEIEIPKRLGIEIIDNQFNPDDYPYNIDEKALRQFLSSKINYKNELALTTDITSISAVMRLRKGKKRLHIEDSTALFVTSNYTLSNATREFFLTKDDVTYIPPLMHDYSVSNLVWIKNPSLSPDLPKQKLIANCYEALSPSDRFWNKYTKKINELEEKKQEITTEDIVYLRFSPLSKEFIMNATLGNEDKLDTEVILSSLESIDERTRTALNEVKYHSDIEKKQLLEQIKTLESEKTETRKNKINTIKKRCNLVTNFIFIVIAIIFVAMLFISLGYLNIPTIIRITIVVIASVIVPALESFGIIDFPKFKVDFNDKITRFFIKNI